MVRIFRNIGLFFLKLIQICWFIPSTILALFLMLSTILFLSVFFALRMFFWQFTREGQLHRSRKSHKRRLNAITRQGELERKRLSVMKDRQNLDALLGEIHELLEQREKEISINALVQTELTLRNCRKDSNFKKALQIYYPIFEIEPCLLKIKQYSGSESKLT